MLTALSEHVISRDDSELLQLAAETARALRAAQEHLDTMVCMASRKGDGEYVVACKMFVAAYEAWQNVENQYGPLLATPAPVAETETDDLVCLNPKCSGYCVPFDLRVAYVTGLTTRCPRCHAVVASARDVSGLSGLPVTSWQETSATSPDMQDRYEGPETEDISAARGDGVPVHGDMRVSHSEDGDSFPFGVEWWNETMQLWLPMRSPFNSGGPLRWMSQGEAEQYIAEQLDAQDCRF